jgi:opacity protein-like surface antigen
MKNFLWGAAALAILAIGPASAADIEFKPIDTQKLVVQPSKAAAGLAASTINLVGQTAAKTVEKNGYVKTINNLLGKRFNFQKTQNGPSALPTPTMFSSTQYKSFNTPVTPSTQGTRR